MLNLGKVRPGSAIRIPFDSSAASTGAPSATTNLAVGDIKIFKDGSTTERASTSGFTLLDTDGLDFDGLTGLNAFSIDLADNTTADFYQSGSEYLVAIADVTIDSQTVRFWSARFTIGEEGSYLDTFIASLASQTSFTLNAGPAEDDALKGQIVWIHDAASAVQRAVGVCSAYTGSTKTVTLAAAPTFTIAAKDNISFMGPAALQPVTPGRQIAVDSSNLVAVPDTQKVDLNTIKAQTITCAAGVTVLASVGTAATSIAQTGDSYAIANSGTHGNAALKTLVDAVSAKTTNLPSDPADQSELAGLISALSSQLNSAVWAQTRFRFSVPEAVEIPESGTAAYVLGISTYDSSGVLTDCDATPTVAAYYADGTSAAALFGSVTRVGTGLYNVTLSVADTFVGPKFVRLVGSAAMSALSIGMTDYVWIVDDVSPDFSSTDRTKLTTLYDDWANGGRLDLILDARASQTSVDDIPTTSELTSALASSDDATLAAIAALNNLSAAQVNAEVDAALADYDPPTNAEMEARTLLAANYATAANQNTILTDLATANTALAKFTTMVVLDGAVYQYTANALELGPGGGDVEVDSFAAGALAQLAALDTINVTGAVTGAGVLNLTQGGDYLTTDGRQLQFVNAAGSLPSLSGATPYLVLKNAGTTHAAITGTVITASGANQRVDFDVTDTTTNLLTAIRGEYEVYAVLSNGSVVPIETGVLNVTLKVRS